MDHTPRNEHLTLICEKCQYEAAWCACEPIPGQADLFMIENPEKPNA